MPSAFGVSWEPIDWSPISQIPENVERYDTRQREDALRKAIMGHVSEGGTLDFNKMIDLAARTGNIGSLKDIMGGVAATKSIDELNALKLLPAAIQKAMQPQQSQEPATAPPGPVSQVTPALRPSVQQTAQADTGPRTQDDAALGNRPRLLSGNLTGEGGIEVAPRNTAAPQSGVVPVPTGDPNAPMVPNRVQTVAYGPGGPAAPPSGNQSPEMRDQQAELIRAAYAANAAAGRPIPGTQGVGHSPTQVAAAGLPPEITTGQSRPGLPPQALALQPPGPEPAPVPNAPPARIAQAAPTPIVAPAPAPARPTGQLTPEQTVARWLQNANPLQQRQAQELIALSARLPPEIGRNLQPLLQHIFKGNDLTEDMKNYAAAVAGGGVTESFPDFIRLNKASDKGILVGRIGQEATETKLRYEGDQKAYEEQRDRATKARSQLPLVAEARRLAAVVPPGVWGTLAPKINSVASALGINWTGGQQAELFQAIAQRFMPEMRVPGTGSQSDWEGRVMLSSVPALSQSPEGRQLILDLMEAHIRRETEIAHIRRTNIGNPNLEKILDAYDAKPLLSENQRARLRVEVGMSLTPPKEYPNAEIGHDPTTGKPGWYIIQNGRPFKVVE